MNFLIWGKIPAVEIVIFLVLKLNPLGLEKLLAALI